MDMTTVVKTSVLVVSLVLLNACSGSDEVFEQASTTNTSVGADGLNNSACGSLPVSTALSGNSESAPGTMMVGQLVSGRINPESSTNAEHYWNIELEPGAYHLVLDTESADGSWSNLNIGVSYIQDSREVELLEGNVTDYRGRFHTYFSVEKSRSMILKIQGLNSAKDYVFGMFKNGNPVPAPFFKKCPTINSLSLDTTETFVLPPRENSPNGHWFKLWLTPAGYSINTSASQINGASCQVQYEFSLVGQFGQSERYTPIGSIDKPGPVVTNSVVDFKENVHGSAWIHVQNNNCELSVEFTISQGS